MNIFGLLALPIMSNLHINPSPFVLEIETLKRRCTFVAPSLQSIDLSEDTISFLLYLLNTCMWQGSPYHIQFPSQFTFHNSHITINAYVS